VDSRSAADIVGKQNPAPPDGEVPRKFGDRHVLDKLKASQSVLEVFRQS